MTTCAAAVNGLPLILDCGDYRECDDCDGSPRSVSAEEFNLRWSIRGGK